MLRIEPNRLSVFHNQIHNYSPRPRKRRFPTFFLVRPLSSLWVKIRVCLWSKKIFLDHENGGAEGVTTSVTSSRSLKTGHMLLQPIVRQLMVSWLGGLTMDIKWVLGSKQRQLILWCMSQFLEKCQDFGSQICLAKKVALLKKWPNFSQTSMYFRGPCKH